METERRQALAQSRHGDLPNLNIPTQGSKLSSFSNCGVEESQAEEHLLELGGTQTRVEPVLLDVVERTQQIRPHPLHEHDGQQRKPTAIWLGNVRTANSNMVTGDVFGGSKLIPERWNTFGGSFVIFTPFWRMYEGKCGLGSDVNHRRKFS